MRFSSCSASLLPSTCSSFNSLCEIHTAGLFATMSVIAFNSLCEIRGSICIRPEPRWNSAFNSLCEILLIAFSTVLILNLSILFVRFVCLFCLLPLLHKMLSILFVRFSRFSMSFQLSTNILSILFVRFSDIHKTDSGRHRTFQFSLWDSEIPYELISWRYSAFNSLCEIPGYRPAREERR